MEQGIVPQGNQPPRELTQSPGHGLPPADRSWSPEAQEHSQVWDYVSILINRRWWIVAFAASVLLVGILYTLRAIPKYEAIGRIDVNRETPAPLNLKDGDWAASSEDVDFNVVLETQVRILQSDLLASTVIHNLHLDQSWSNSPAPAAVAPGQLDVQLKADPARESKLLARFRTALKVSVVPRTRIIEIRYTDADPKLAAEIVNAMINTYVEQNFRAKFDAVMMTSDWLTRQLSDLKLKVETSQEKLVQYQKENGILGIDEKQNIITSKLDELNKELTAAEADRIQKASYYQMAQAGNPELFTGRPEAAELLRHLQQQETDLKGQISQVTTQFGPSYPKVVELQNQLAETQTSIKTERQKLALKYKNDYEVAIAREGMLRSALDKQKAEANQLNERAIEYNILKRDADGNRQLYEALQQKVKEAGISAGLKSSNIRVVDAARVPSTPVSPNVPRNILLSLILGVAGGVWLALVVDALDNSVRSPEQAQTLSRLPVLATIPRREFAVGTPAGRARLRLGPGARITPVDPVLVVDAKSISAEAFRSLRTSILLSSAGKPPQVIMVSSALPKEGKTTVSLNIAISLAQNSNRVLLVDADMRRPNVHASMRLPNTAGLSTMLTNAQSTFAPLAVPSVPNLRVIPGGPVAPHPAELLSSPVMLQYIQRWRQEYDHIIIDTPPALSVTDPVLLSINVDSVVIVVRAGQTNKGALRMVRDVFGRVNARVLGVVVNAFEPTKAGAYYGTHYYGTYYQQYGYGEDRRERG